MKLPYSWLKELVPEVPAVSELSDILPQLGLGVEDIHELEALPKGLIVVCIESFEDVTGSDHLRYCQVSDGNSSYSLICGAANVKQGMKTIMAKSGVYLAGAGFTVASKEIMGFRSDAVLCSPKEIGLYDYAGGIIELGDDVALGAELNSLWPAETVLELEITPNRADAFSLLGVARDIAAKLEVPYLHPAADLKLTDETLDDGLEVHIEDQEACPRFTLQRIDDVTVKPSPLWLQHRLAALGLRPRNNVVDVTNYVTFELGQPSHAYDKDNVNKGRIIVRRAKLGEGLVTLTEQALDLEEKDLIIAMPEAESAKSKPIGLAGVIGGLHDSINPHTKNVALEAAHFDPVVVRKSAKRHGLLTDAHYRFERGVDPNLPRMASARAAQLIAEVSGGKVHPGFTQIGEDRPSKTLEFRPSRVKFLMTLDIPLALQQQYLEALGCTVELKDQDCWIITVPSWRFDLALEEDIIEEVSRLYGYDHITETVPAMPFIPKQLDVTHRHLRNRLAGLGLQETMTYVFQGEAELAKANAPLAQVKLANPQGIERSVLRPVLYPGLLKAAASQAARSLALFEIGHVFQEEEHEHLAVLMQGSLVDEGWQQGKRLDFYGFKGIFENLAAQMGSELRLEPDPMPHLHPGISAAVYWQEKPIGHMGKLHPEVAARYEIKDAFLAEVRLPLELKPIQFHDYARQPHAERDLAVIIPKELSYHSLQALVKGSAGQWLESVKPFDLYEGEKIPEGKRSIALRLWFRHPERALTDNEVDTFMANVISTLASSGYPIRDK